jgi:putative ABC transport system permease protein
VVENKSMVFFNFGKTRATIYSLRSELPYQVIRIARDDVSGALGRIDATWKALAPNVAIERHFVDEIFNGVYESYRRVSQIFGVLAGMAFLISVTGLFGTATFVTSRRLREIGVRKAFGASTGRIVGMFLTSFSKPVIVANVLVWPLAFAAASAYLETFRNPVELGPLPFVLSLVVVCAIAWFAVGTQTLRAARALPADVLRHE